MSNTRDDKMTVLQLTILTAVNMMGSGIIMLPTKLAMIGTVSVLSWLVTGIGSMCLAYAFAKCGMFSRRIGGMGGYAEYSFGKAGNFLANYTYSVSLLVANIAIAISVVGYALEFLEITTDALGIGLWTVGTLWLASILNFRGARFTGRIFSVTVWGVILPVVGISVIGWFWFDPVMYIEAWNPHGVSLFDGISDGIAMTLWAFLGLESACANSETVENPEENVPKAVLGATLGVAVIYVLSTNVMAGIVPNAELAVSEAPFGLAFAQMFNPFVGKIVMGLMILSCFGSLLGWQFTIAQVFKISADVGYFPKIFSHSTIRGTPLIGIIIITAVQSIFAMTTASDSLYEQFEILVNLSVVTNLIPYLLAMGAVIVIQKAAGVYSSFTTAMAFCGSMYSLYALYTAGFEAMTYGSIATFLGWTLYGFVSARFDLEEAKAHNRIAEEQRKNLTII